MRLIDIILESEAAKEATRLGLVKKPGVALYGPPGDENPASHKIRGGELTPLKLSGTTSQTQQTSSVIGHTNAPVTDPAPEEKSTENRRELKVEPVPNIEDIAQKIMETISPEGKIRNIRETLRVVTAAFGRKKLPRIVKLTPLLLEVGDVPTYMRPYVLGIYILEYDIIAIKHKLSDKPIDEWERVDVTALCTYIHEALHSARYLPDNMPSGPPYIGSTNENRRQFEFIDEGMTEYLTQEIISAVLSGTPQLDLYNQGPKSYPTEIGAIRLMVEYGGLDVAEAFLNKSYTIDEETGKVHWDYMQQISDAHTTTFKSILSKAGFAETDIDWILGMLKVGEGLGSFAIFDKNIFHHLNRLIKSGLSFDPSVFIDQLKDLIMVAFKNTVDGNF
jgi:hypothetical protein